MLSNIKLNIMRILLEKFFTVGLEKLHDIFVKPFVSLPYYKKCFWLILAGLLLYIPYLNGYNSNHDEQYALIVSRYSLADLIKTILAEDTSPPLSYLYNKFWILLFNNPSYDILALRIGTLFCFLATALLGVFPLKRLLGEKTALIFICLVFLMPSAYYLAINIRMYPLAVFLISGTFLYGMLLVYKPQKYDWLLFSVFSLLALYTHLYCAILCVIIWLVVLADLLRLKKYQQLVPFFISGGIVAILFAPWVLAFYLQCQNNKDAWWGDISYVKKALMGTLMLYESCSENYYFQSLIFGDFCWVLLILFLFGAKKDKLEHIIAKRAIIIYLSLILIAFLITVTLLPILFDRYLLVCIGLFYISVAVSFVYFKKLRLLFLCLLLFVFVFGYRENYLRAQDKGYKELQTFLLKEMPQNSLVLYHHGRGHLMMEFYAPNTDIYFVPMNIYHVLLQDRAKKEVEHLADLSKYDNIYYLLTLYKASHFDKCDKLFTNGYDNITQCFIKISKEEALKYIENTKSLREQLLQQEK